jgi:hypothetical protein
VDDSNLISIGAAFGRAMNSVTLTGLARDSKFCERMRTVSPHEVVVGVIAAMATQSTQSIADIQRTFNALSGHCTAYKPFHKKLAKAQFPTLMRAVVCHLLNELVTDALAPLDRSVLSQFDDILLHDGTSFAVHDALAQVFPGRHTTISPAAVELHATLSLWCDQPVGLSITADTAAEREQLPEPAELRGRLLIGDRGYQDIDYCREVDVHGGYVLIRHQTQINPAVIESFVDGNPVAAHRGRRLHDIMSKHRGKTIDVDAQWQGVGGTNRPDTRLRVVLLWNPRRRDPMALVTNLDRARFSPLDLYKIYRLRWQVELLFKEWKSHCNLHKFITTKAPIAEGLMWAALAACILKRFMAKAAQLVFDVGEVSTLKTALTVGHHLYALLQAVLDRHHIRAALLSLLRHLSTQALRSHPNRDRATGRLNLGIRPITA